MTAPTGATYVGHGPIVLGIGAEGLGNFTDQLVFAQCPSSATVLSVSGQQLCQFLEIHRTRQFVSIEVAPIQRRLLVLLGDGASERLAREAV